MSVVKGGVKANGATGKEMSVVKGGVKANGATGKEMSLVKGGIKANGAVGIGDERSKRRGQGQWSHRDRR